MRAGTAGFAAQAFGPDAATPPGRLASRAAWRNSAPACLLRSRQRTTGLRLLRLCPARRPRPRAVCRAGSAGWPGLCQCRRRQPWAGRHRIGFPTGRLAALLAAPPQARRRLSPLCRMPAIPPCRRSVRPGAGLRLRARTKPLPSPPLRFLQPGRHSRFRLDRHSSLDSVASGRTAADTAPQPPRSACLTRREAELTPGLARPFFAQGPERRVKARP